MSIWSNGSRWRGYRIRRDTRLSVATSARQIGRAQPGSPPTYGGMLAEPERDTA